MVAKNYFSHTSLDGRSPFDRISATGYQWWSVGENISANPASVNAVIDAWMASPGHCANIMNPNFRDAGLACVAGGSSNTYRLYWTLDLAQPR